MKLHQNIELFIDAISRASKFHNISESIIEKDYWNTAILYKISHSELAAAAVLKGGTSLFKCHKLTKRLPIDLDIVIPRNRDSENSTIFICNTASKVLPEVKITGLTYSGGMIKRTTHGYRTLFDNIIPACRYVILDISWLGSDTPFVNKSINSFVGQMMIERNMHKDIALYNMESFEIKTLSYERTFCEKIILLANCSFSKDPYQALTQKIAHIYDLHYMLREQKVKSFLYSISFNQILLNVKKDDLECFGRKCSWFNKHPSEALVFKEPEESWKKINDLLLNSSKLSKESYPSISEENIDIIQTIKTLSERVNSISWD